MPTILLYYCTTVLLYYFLLLSAAAMFFPQGYIFLLCVLNSKRRFKKRLRKITKFRIHHHKKTPLAVTVGSRAVRAQDRLEKDGR